jgi:HAE1 family hydrophobic/amphiphilic exporter-1
MNIAGLAIKRPVFIVMIVLSIVTLGAIGYVRLPVDLLPNVDYPAIVVMTTYTGSSSEEIEQLITRPLENTLGAVEGLDTLDSISREGLSIVICTMSLGVDMKMAELNVRDKVQQAMPQLPTDVTAPQIVRFSSDDTPILYFAIRGNRTLPELNQLIQDRIQPRLEAVNGVGSIGISGAQNRIVKITVNPALMDASGLDYSQIVTAVNRKHVDFPAGTIYAKNRNIAFRVAGKSQKVSDFADIQMQSASGTIVRIGDIAKVEMGLDDEVERDRVDGTNAVLFFVYKQTGENTVAISHGAQKVMEEIKKDLPGDCKVDVISDSAVEIERSVKGVQNDIILGALLAIIIVWIFLGNFRSTMITAVALPNSLIGSFLLVNGAGFTLNTMTLLALSLAVGLLIDDSIVVRENIFRYIEEGYDPKTAAEKGTNEVALAVLSTTLSIMAVFIPISFLSGVIGQFFREFGLTVAFALLISLVDAFTSAPMLSAYWFKKSDTKSTKGLAGFFNMLTIQWNVFYDKLKDIYIQLLKWSLGHKAIVIIVTVVLFAGSLYLSKFIGGNFMSNGDSGLIALGIETYPGASLDVTDGYVKAIEEKLSHDPEIDLFYVQVGGTLSHTANININMKAVKDRKSTTQQKINELRAWMHQKFEKDLIYRFTERSILFAGAGGGGGFSGPPLQINIIGPDYDVLRVLADKMSQVISSVPGVADLNTTYKPGVPELVVHVDERRAQALGSSVLELGTILRDMVEGYQITTYTVNDHDYDVIIQLKDTSRNSISQVENLMITTRNGTKVPVSSFVTFEYHSAPLDIRRESKQRLIRLYGNILDGYSMSDTVARVDKEIAAKVVIPDGCRYYYGGQQKQFADLSKQIVVAVSLAILFMYMILASLYNSFHQPLILMISLPLAIIGAFFGLLITATPLDIYGYIGILLVLGLVAKNAILLIDFTNHSREQGMSVHEALLHAGPVRLRPILMTSFAMIFGMLPLALGLDEGSRGRQALPMSVIGGILTSTFMTLLVVPIIYEAVESRLEKRKKEKEARKALEHSSN